MEIGFKGITNEYLNPVLEFLYCYFMHQTVKFFEIFVFHKSVSLLDINHKRLMCEIGWYFNIFLLYIIKTNNFFSTTHVQNMVKIKFVNFLEMNHFISSTFFRISHFLAGKLNFLFLITFFTNKTKIMRFIKKLSKLNFSWDEPFYSLTFSSISHSLAGKWIFWFCKSRFWCIKSEPLVKMWHKELC